MCGICGLSVGHGSNWMHIERFCCFGREEVSGVGNIPMRICLRRRKFLVCCVLICVGCAYGWDLWGVGESGV